MEATKSLVKWVPRNLRDDGMIAASEVAHYTHLDLIEYVKLADLTALVEGLRRINTLAVHNHTDAFHGFLMQASRLIARRSPGAGAGSASSVPGAPGAALRSSGRVARRRRGSVLHIGTSTASRVVR